MELASNNSAKHMSTASVATMGGGLIGDKNNNMHAGPHGADNVLTLKIRSSTSINNTSNNTITTPTTTTTATATAIDNNHNIAASGVTNNINRSNSGGHLVSSSIVISDKNVTPRVGSSTGAVRYKECLKNHAANMGGYAVDGCGEFMPSGEEGSLEALKCAACGCHRNFHRRETNGGSVSAAATLGNSMSLLALPSTINAASNTSTSNSDYGDQAGDHHPNNHSNSGAITPGGSGGPGPFGAGHNYSTAAGGGHMQGGALVPHLHPHHHHHPYMHAWMGPPGKLVQPAAAAHAGAVHHAGMHAHHTGAGPYSYMGMGPAAGHMMGGTAACAAGGGTPQLYGGGGGGKRFRTKFTMEQREKMFEFSEKVGWRIHKHDEAAVQQFCAETGVKRHVLKVWMHNNKNTFGKKLLRFPEAFNAMPESSS